MTDRNERRPGSADNSEDKSWPRTEQSGVGRALRA